MLGRYQLIKKLATGGMAEVFLASADGPGGFSKQLVVKRILPHYADNPQFVQMFLSEAKLAAQLNHPNVVQVFDFGQVGRDYFLAMEFVDGMNLRTLNRMHRNMYGPMPMAACARMISQACEGLAYAHGFRDPKTGKPVNLVHRDISPDNLIISKHGAVKVLDFGIAKAETQVHKTTTGMLKGKMAYMPPEQLQREVLDQRVDVYALGVVLFELLAGSLPFDATSEVSIIQAVMKPDPLPPLSGLVDKVPPALEQCVARALAKSRDVRYPDCKAFQNDLESFIQSTGEKCMPSDLARLVEAAEAGHQAETGNDLQPYVPQGGGDEDINSSTHLTPQSRPGVDALATPDRPITGVSSTQLKPVTGESPAAAISEPSARGGGAGKGALAAAVVLVVCAAAVTSWVLFGRGRGEGPIVVPPPPALKEQPVVKAEVDAGAAVVVAEAAPEVDAGAVADVAVAVVPHAGPSTGKHGSSKPPPPSKAKGEVEVRVRPYAVLWVDGEQIGQTPLDEPLSLSVGKHTFRLVNEQVGKDVKVDFNVKPGKSVFKFNLVE
ncbi:MAG: serine/threonine protein kinase [Archangiaceae bacterium]|nr:serine/threonine protein kinase [Archangiaceae bacterium]